MDALRDTARPTVLDEGAVSALRANLRGTLFRAGDAGYDEARKVWNGMIDRHPALIARCAGVADVIAAVNFAREQGLRALVHAGEIGGPGEVRRAVELLGAERIGHGIGAVLDPAVMQLLRERGIPLEVCPISNLRTGALARLRGQPGAGLAQHPVAELFRAGVPLTLSTDDPGMFETNLIQEYSAAAEAGLTVQELARIALAGFDAAFLPQKEKTALAAPLRRTLAAQGLL